VFSILYHINVYRILLLMPASSVAIALALRKNRSLGKTFWFTVPLSFVLINRQAIAVCIASHRKCGRSAIAFGSALPFHVSGR
jgi:hypothetical protein